MRITIQEWNERTSLFNKVDQSINDKLTYAIKKLRQRAQSATKPFTEKMQEEFRDFSVKHAAVDEKGILLEKDGRFQFTMDNQLKVTKEEKRLNKAHFETAVEIEPFTIDSEEPGYQRATILFDDFDREQLAGILFPDMDNIPAENDKKKIKAVA